MAVVAAGVVALATFSPELIIIVSGAAYTDALPAVGLSLVFALGFAAFQVVTMPSAISRRMRNLGLAAAIAACSGIWLNLWWAPAHGSTGTAAAIAVGQFAGVGAGIALAREHAPVPYQWGRMVFVTAVAAAYSCAITLPGGVTAVAGRGLLAVVVILLLADMDNIVMIAVPNADTDGGSGIAADVEAILVAGLGAVVDNNTCITTTTTTTAP